LFLFADECVSGGVQKPVQNNQDELRRQEQENKAKMDQEKQKQ
jgi:hypothetical protein